MNLSNVLAPHIPLLRRYARALTGSQRSGDAYVAATLQALIEDRTAFDMSLPPRVALYRVFHAIWGSAHIDPEPPAEGSGLAAKAQERLSALTPLSRQALLLTDPRHLTGRQVHASETAARPDPQPTLPILVQRRHDAMRRERVARRGGDNVERLQHDRRIRRVTPAPGRPHDFAAV